MGTGVANQELSAARPGRGGPAGLRPTLVLHLVWHGASEEASQLARAVFTHVCADPSVPTTRRLGIPVRLWRSQPAEAWATVPAPRRIAVDAAEHSVVVVLVDDNLVLAGWDDYLRDLVASAPTDGPHRVVPVALTPNFGQLAALKELNAVRLQDLPAEARGDVLLNRITHALCRLLSTTSDPVKVFFSHAKRDGEDIARAIREYLQRDTGIADFFDSADIPPGSRFADVIVAEAGTCALLAVQTDAYASREWCRVEVLHAKLAGAPIVVVDALERGETRSFPYLGNVPVVRWDETSPAAVERLLGVLLFEVLRCAYFRSRAADICALHHLDVPEHTIPHPPELLTLLTLRGQKPGTDGAALPVLYPDPPLGREELALLHRLDPGIDPVTPTILVSR